MTPLMPGAGPPPTKIASLSVMSRAHPVDRSALIVGNEKRALWSDRDPGRATDPRGAAALKAGDEIGPLRRRIRPVHALRGTIPAHRDEDDARGRGAAAVRCLMPRSVRGDEESAAIRGRERVPPALVRWVEGGTDDRRVGRQLDQRLDGLRTVRAGCVRAIVLLALRPAVIGDARMRREIVEKLVGMAGRQIVLAGIADPYCTRLRIDGERDRVANACGALQNAGAVGLHDRNARAAAIDFGTRLSVAHGCVTRGSCGDVEETARVRYRRGEVDVAVAPGRLRSRANIGDP